MIVLNSFPETLNQYTLSIAYDLSTATYDNVSANVSAQVNSPQSFWLNPTGSKLYVLSSSSDLLHQFVMSTPFDLSTISYDNIVIGLTSDISVSVELVFSNDGKRFFIIDNGGSVFQYSLDIAWDLQLNNYTGIEIDFSELSGDSIRGAVFKDDGKYLFGVGSDSVPRIHEFSTNFMSLK